MPVFVLKNGNWSGKQTGAQITGEKIPGDLATWVTNGTDSNDIVTDTYGLLQKRSMTLYHTYGPAAAAINKQATYAVGPGLLFRSQPDHDILGITQQEAKEWGKRFQKLYHYWALSKNYYAKQSPLMKGAMSMGDSFLFFDYLENGDFDIIESGGDSVDDKITGEGVQLGIYHDKLLRKQAIASRKGGKIPFRNKAGNQNVVQLMFKELPRQLRGMSLIYRIINHAKNHDRFWDATVQRAVLESIMMGWSETEKTDWQKQAQTMGEDLKAKKGGSEGDGGFMGKIGNAIRMGAGNIFNLKKSEGMKFTDLKTPSNNFDKFNDGAVELAGMATETPPEVITSKYSTSYTAHKGAMNDFIKSYTWKRGIFSNTIDYPVRREFLRYAVNTGMISAPGYNENDIIQRAWLNGNHIGPVPGAINPVQEVNSEVKRVEAGFKLRSDAAIAYGNDFDNMILERAEEEQAFYNSNPENRAAIIAAELAKQNEGNTDD